MIGNLGAADTADSGVDSAQLVALLSWGIPLTGVIVIFCATCRLAFFASICNPHRREEKILDAVMAVNLIEGVAIALL